MGPDEVGEAGSAASSTTEEEDAYHLPSEDDESSLSSLSESDYAGESSKPNLTKSPRPKSKRSRKDLEEQTDRKQLTLNSRQKEVVREIWDMLKPKAKDGGRSSNILGREDVKYWVRTLGEMWSEDEVSLDRLVPVLMGRLWIWLGCSRLSTRGEGLILVILRRLCFAPD